MKNVTRFAFVLALSVGSLAAVGCGGSVEQPQSQASAASKAPIGQSTHGVVKMVGEALGEVPLRPEQRAELEKLATAAEARHASMVDGRKELMLAIADQIEKGAVDKAALQPKIDRVAADMDKARPEDTQALAKVHALLDPQQRNAFVDALEAKFARRGHGGPGHHGKGKHGDGEKGDGPKADGPRGEGGEHHGPRAGMHDKHGMRGMKQLAEDLKLSDDQKDKIKDVMKEAFQKKDRPSMQEMRARMGEGKKALESFRTDKFDAQALTPPADKARLGDGHFIGLAEKIVPILTPEQRKLAADKIRGMAERGGPVPFAR